MMARIFSIMGYMSILQGYTDFNRNKDTRTNAYIDLHAVDYLRHYCMHGRSGYNLELFIETK